MATKETERGDGLISLLHWPSIGLGFVVATVMAIGLGTVSAALGSEQNLGLSASLEFVALMAGGYVAASRAGRVGVMQAVAVAVIFILISASIKAWVEIDLAGRFGPHVLGPMDMGGLILGDLVHLVGACAGGWLADSRRSAERSG
jgi:hypothetical protein